MAGRRVYGASNMAALLQNQGISALGIEDLLASGSPPGIHGPRSVMNNECNNGRMLGKSFHWPLNSKESGDQDLDELFHRSGKKRRLTVDQMQFLEKSFLLENKLEPERKTQLAKDLGVQPQQVAIWFQNRRARCKTKQLEKDYEVLKYSYGVLKAEYGNHLKENEKLKAEVLRLTDQLKLKGKDKSSSGPFNLSKPTSQLQNPDHDDLFSQETKSSTPRAVCKQEELSSVDSAASGSNRSHCRAGLSINALEENEEAERYNYLELKDNSFSSEFPPVYDQSFWLWP